MSEDIRTKIVVDNLVVCRKYLEHLTEWEQDFIFSICENSEAKPLRELTGKQFNKLHDIASDLRKRFFKELIRGGKNA